MCICNNFCILSFQADLAKRVGYKLYIVFARINDVRSQVSVESKCLKKIVNFQKAH